MLPTDAQTEQIKPIPSFVVKAKAKSGRKVFVNVCTSAFIEVPHWKPLVGDEAEKLIKSGCTEAELGSDGEYRVPRIPMAIGQLLEDHDKKGDICSRCDVVVHPMAVNPSEKEMVDPQALSVDKSTLVGLVVRGVFTKHQLDLDESQPPSIPNMTYKGDFVPYQRVRVTRLNEVSVVSSASAESDIRLAPSPRSEFIYELFLETPHGKRTDILLSHPALAREQHGMKGVLIKSSRESDSAQNQAKFVQELAAGAYLVIEIGSDSMRRVKSASCCESGFKFNLHSSGDMLINLSVLGLAIDPKSLKSSWNDSETILSIRVSVCSESNTVSEVKPDSVAEKENLPSPRLDDWQLVC